MRLMWRISLGLCLVVLCSGQSWAETHLIILAGQSNMMGRGYTAKLPATYKQTPSNVSFFYQGREQKLAKFAFFGPEVSFAHVVARAFPHDKIILVKHAASGSYVKQWQPQQSLYKSLIRQVGYAVDAYPVKRVDAILWMQGESEAQSTLAVANQYSGLLQTFMQHLRTDLQSPNSLLVLGRISLQHPLLVQPINAIRMQQQHIPQQIRNSLVISTDGLSTLGDKLHYDTEGQVELGKRFAAAYLRHYRR